MAYMIDIPEKTCGNGVHFQYPAQVPVFHFIQKDGYHGIAGLETVKSWARDIHSGEVPAEEIYRELYVILPRGRSLLPCAITFAGSGDRLKMVISGTAAISGPLYTIDL